MNRRLRTPLLAFLLLGLLGTVGLLGLVRVGTAFALQANLGGDGVAPAQVEPEAIAPEALIVKPAPGDVRVRIQTDRSRYRVGESVQIRFWVSEPAYVYIYNVDSRGRVRLIFPNRFDANNRVRAGEHQLPGAGYRFRVDGPPGTEYLQILAIRTRLRPLERWNARDPFPLLGGNPLAVKEEVLQFLDVVPERSWSSAWTQFEVIGRQARGPRRETGTVRINSEPPWAQVYLDGAYVGLTPLLQEVPAGGHWVEIRLEGYRTARRWILVEPGELTPVFLHLERW